MMEALQVGILAPAVPVGDAIESAVEGALVRASRLRQVTVLVWGKAKIDFKGLFIVAGGVHVWY